MSKTIMVVDDEENLRTLIKSVLERKGYNIITAINGDDCLNQLKKEKKIDLILMDVMMPGTPVKEVVKKIKDIKIAFLSVVGVTESEKKDLCKMKNICAYLTKPFDIDKLAKEVKKMVGE